MSGGVDSAVAAALLHREGYAVIGITLQLYDHGEAVGRSGTCCAGQDIHDAGRVARKLGIPHYVLDYEQRFKSVVMDSFAASYMAGETPVPCVACNSQIKFQDLLETAKSLDAEHMATGHYVQLKSGPCGPELYRAADPERDQSYFLFNTTRTQLATLMFPLGGLRKSEVRAMATELDLPVAEKSDSQDICFVPTGRYTDVIERLKPGAAEPGDIVHIDGRVLGRHNGIINFTVGQRRGIGIAGTADPLFVVRLDAAACQVVVGPRSSLSTGHIQLRDVNWIADQDLESAAGNGLPVFVRVRSSQAPRPATLFASEGTATVMLDTDELGIAAGQACVFYAEGHSQARVLGGGWIARATRRGSRSGAVQASERQVLNDGRGPVRSAH
jgi:tRNA-specific 2-thiouridylase